MSSAVFTEVKSLGKRNAGDFIEILEVPVKSSGHAVCLFERVLEEDSAHLGDFIQYVRVLGVFALRKCFQVSHFEVKTLFFIHGSDYQAGKPT